MQDNKSIPEQTNRVTAVNSSNWRRTVITIVITALVTGAGGYLLGMRTNKNASQGIQRVSFQPSPTIIQSSLPTRSPDKSISQTSIANTTPGIRWIT